MWNNTAAISTRPVTQWMPTQLNARPRIGRNAVAMSVSTQTAVTQWKARSTAAWRVTLPATEGVPGLAALGSVTTDAICCFGASNKRYRAWPTISAHPTAKNTQIRSHDMPCSTSRP